MASEAVTRKLGPESGSDCLLCSKFDQPRNDVGQDTLNHVVAACNFLWTTVSMLVKKLLQAKNCPNYLIKNTAHQGLYTK